MATFYSAITLRHNFMRRPLFRSLMMTVCIVLAIISCHSLVQANSNAEHNGTWSSIEQHESDVQLEQPEITGEVPVNEPYFLHIVHTDDTLQSLANTLDITVDQLMMYNPGLAGLEPSDTLTQGELLYVPIPFPLHDEAVLLKSDVLPYRFVAAYGIPVTFSRVADIETWFIEHLVSNGYEILLEQTNGDISFQGDWVARGSIQLSPGDDTYQTWVHIALVIDEYSFPLPITLETDNDASDGDDEE